MNRPPIRRGTASRLGLKRWPGGILIFPKEVTPEQLAEFEERFVEAWRTGPTILLASSGVTFERSGDEATRRGAQWRIARRGKRRRAARARRQRTHGRIAQPRR